MKYNIIKNKYNYYEVENKPSSEELQEYYSKKYYQEGAGSYEISYDNDEKIYFLNKIEQKHQVVKSMLKKEIGKLLDIGSGEGFSLKYFDELGWDCTGLDFSDYGISQQNPRQKKLLIAGDISNNIQTIISKGKKFDLIWLDNVLEHVINPFQLLLDIHKILDKNGVLVIDVPNDFSIIQNYLLKNKHIDREFWVCPPDHLSYFSKEGLSNITKATGWDIKKTISDHPIDMDLLNPNSNYVINPKTGKGAHKKRIEFESLLHSISIDKTNRFYEAMADLGIGRNIVNFLIKK
ncbi:MAG: class I SAM-dependent methyltransferase [Methylococcales symbiont of Iophon sp. n. MRB-2018]|nr:MAG: class I SAM-dependent methyltransferase [Methylococcales symbiont of Iophon sp. n. MRB-2018]KAF3980527.1 MAG: class I SAM-dependent methyltransferase [Methylococcales symbiont of Iophon sp. n. MRB-2018]